MKRVGLVLLGCLLLSLVAHAGHFFTNHTGVDATGLRVVFSEPVSIDSFGDAFTEVAPSGTAREFVFSGGVVTPWGGVWFNQTPTTASVERVEWQTGSAEATATTAANLVDSTRPLTYEEIMAKIAKYPGPDEPLYEPKEGEQIWLTDLEGHADIYDNDSIKINYALGFDKSQIARIDVYRNGVKLRFLPALFDVLTNEQMKTFDGNPAENTPKSSHTDHAIFGYEYSLRFFTTAGVVSKVLSTKVSSPVSIARTTYVQGGCIWLYLDQPDSVLLSVFAEWKAMGFDGLQFSAYYFMRTDTSSEVFAQYTFDTTILNWWERTMTRDEIRRVLRLTREAGLEAELRIELWLAKPYAQQTSRASITPNWEKWFTNYTTLCVEMAQLAQEGGCRYFTPMVELTTVMFQTARVRKLLDAIDAVFTGTLCISWATCDDFLPVVAYGSGLNTGMQGDFWDWVGRNSRLEASIELWPGFVALAQESDARFSEVVANFAALYKGFLVRFAQSYATCSVRFGELGWSTYDGVAAAGMIELSGAYVGRELGATGRLDYQEFADCWAAFLVGADWLGIDVAVWSINVLFEESWHLLGDGVLNFTPATRIVDALLE